MPYEYGPIARLDSNGLWKIDTVFETVYVLSIDNQVVAKKITDEKVINAYLELKSQKKI